MKTRTKRTLTHAAIGGFTLIAVGLRIGFWLADHLKPSANSRAPHGDDFPKEAV